MGSNVERMKRRRVVKRRRKHIEIVDWALERRALLELELILLKECGEGEEEILVAMIGVGVLFSSGKKTHGCPCKSWVLLLGMIPFLLSFFSLFCLWARGFCDSECEAFYILCYSLLLFVIAGFLLGLCLVTACFVI